ncbi:MAG TPA: SDR family oxidoreductase [Candidatus Polarisedimenticolaceae bacterium]|nr:SDR family oxidoreductase [Candidatus Polarisedimenticolaceae bacterium]
MATFVVTGGGGFIGSNLAETILKGGDAVRVLDNFETGRRVNLADAPAWAAAGRTTYTLIEGDIRDLALCRRAVEGADYVLHQAAIPSVQRSIQDPISSNEVNVTGTLNVLLAARDAKVKRVVMASSSSLYGDSETLPKVETMAPAPISPYGLQKLAGETYLGLFHRLYGVPTVALRYFNVFGPRQDPGSEYSAVIPRFMASIRAGSAPTIYGDGEQTRDFSHIANIVQANLKACAAPESALGAAYNIACGERISLNELVAIVAEFGGREVRPVYAPERQGDIKHSLAAIGKAEQALGYRPTVSVHEGLRLTWDAS